MLELGLDDDVDQVSSEIIAELRDVGLGAFPEWTYFASRATSRSPEVVGELRRVLGAVTAHRPVRAALAFMNERLVDAAEILAEIEDVATEADVRLLAAEQLAAAGRHRDAVAQLERALAFYRSVGATRYIRQGEALLAKSA